MIAKKILTSVFHYHCSILTNTEDTWHTALLGWGKVIEKLSYKWNL